MQVFEQGLAHKNHSRRQGVRGLPAPMAPQAARTLFMNFPTSRFSLLLSFESDCAAERTWDDAVPVSDAPRWTSEMAAATCDVPSAARCTLREISWVAAPCSSTADAIADEISEIRPMVVPISLIAVTESPVADWMSATC